MEAAGAIPDRPVRPECKPRYGGGNPVAAGYSGTSARFSTYSAPQYGHTVVPPSSTIGR